VNGVRNEPAGEVTALLRRWRDGDRSVETRLMEMVHPELYRLACYLMSRERRDHSLQPTALLNEAYVRLVSARQQDWQDRHHFFAFAARSMRRLLIDHARGRPPVSRVPLDGIELFMRGGEARLHLAISIDRLLQDIERSHPTWCAVVDMKFYLGLTDEETAEALGLPLRSMQRQFADARRWLYEKLNHEVCRPEINTMST
jgi:RNA polymerase sigma-70 factor, ECF subfamily